MSFPRDHLWFHVAVSALVVATVIGLGLVLQLALPAVRGDAASALRQQGVAAGSNLRQH